ncbi:MAG TPA: PA14 domain-containing protein [Candidatus Limnocylindria bacterium]|jgi:hypothetical protein|nr:PA14 domain-containing protein [Candidatus Limnocylindria bacterium]
MKLHRLHKPLGILSTLCVAGYTTFAGHVEYNFDSDPSGILQLFHNSTWQATDGNPSSGGYLSITDALNGQSGAILFDDFDNGLVVKAFSFSMDVRVGGGTDSPADGISINYCRASDPVLVSAADIEAAGTTADNLPAGWAGSVNGGETNLPEEGATTGLGIGFDAWYSGGDGSRATNPHTLTDDVIGISVRLDGTLIYQSALPTLNGACTDVTSLQTGPQDPDNPGSPGLLCWQPLNVDLSEDGTLIIKYKNVEVTPAGGLHTTFAPSPGRLVLVGRTGGANQNNHIDNIKITTVPATTPTIGTVSSNPTGFQFTATDAGPIHVVPETITVTMNGTAVTVSSVAKTGSDTLVKVSTAPNLIPAGSTNTVVASFKDDGGTSYTATRLFVEGAYAVVPPAFALPAGAVDTTKGGFSVKSYQTDADNQNSLALTEQELAGVLGPNLAGTDVFAETGVINYAKVDAGDGQQGNFGGETQLPGFPGTGPNNGYDHAALEILGYVRFPAAGTYTWGVSSDDGFRVSVAPSVGEKLNTVALGQFNGGRGASIPGTEFAFYVSQAGDYPVRTIWENGGGGSNIELFQVNDDGTLTLVNDSVPGAIKFFSASSVVRPWVGFASPEPGLFAENRQVSANTPLKVVLVDGSADAINQGSIKLNLNGTDLSPTITKSGKQTTVSVDTHANLLPVGTSTATISYSAGSGPVVSSSWKFIVTKYSVLDVATSAPLGSEDPAHPGFKVKTYALDIPGGSPTTPAGTQAQNLVSYAEQELLGLFGPNVADTATVASEVSGVINYDAFGGPQGNFGSDAQFPGIPSKATATVATDNFALEFQTYVEFPTAGFYTFGFNSDDGFAAYNSTAPAPLYALNVNAPAGIAGRIGAVSAGSDEGGIGLPLPTTPITAKLVYAQPPLADSDITNTADVTNNIVLIDRGVASFTDKLNRAVKAGAKAVIVANNRDDTSADGVLPFVMGGTAAPAVAVMITKADGDKLKAHLADAGGVTVSVGQDGTTKLGLFNGGRGATDTLFSFSVPQAGLYPIRTIYYEGGGGANAEYFSVQDDGTKVLLNDTGTAGSLKAFSVLKVLPKPTISLSVSGSDIVITYTGTLQSSDSLGAPVSFSNVAGASSPLHVPIGSAAAAKFYRSSN